MYYEHCYATRLVLSDVCVNPRFYVSPRNKITDMYICGLVGTGVRAGDTGAHSVCRSKEGDSLSSLQFFSDASTFDENDQAAEIVLHIQGIQDVASRWQHHLW